MAATVADAGPAERDALLVAALRAAVPDTADALAGRGLPRALAEASLDDARLDADWLRRVRRAGPADATDAAALEVLMYWQAWHHVMRGGLRATWSTTASRP